jgi:protein-disulfide isomerase
MSKQFLGVIAAIILIFAGIFAFSGHNNSPGSSAKGQLTNHVIGKGSTGVKLVEYGDYECPFCGQYYPIVKQVQTEFNDQIFFQFRNFPLVSLHKNAFAGARAAEAAGLQNKFWEMHDALYQSQDPQGASGWVASNDPLDQYFVDFAKQLGLNVDKFKQDYTSDKVNGAINADSAEGNKLGITGTPTFFIDGKKVEIGQSVAEFEKVINAEIAKKGSAASSGTTSQTTSTSQSNSNSSSQTQTNP